MWRFKWSFPGICCVIISITMIITIAFVSRKEESLSLDDDSVLLPTEKADFSKAVSQAAHYASRDDSIYGADKKIELISLIGERNSGTTWMAAHLNECFGHAVTVKDKLVRSKHWFQHDIDIWSKKGERRPNTLVVAQFRDPYYWAEAMRARPHHSPMHYDVKNRKPYGWRHFLRTPWVNDERSQKDLDMLAAHNGNATAVECQEHFNYNQIDSCHPQPYDEADGKSHRFCADLPQYELKFDGSGEAYDSILDLRADKIRNHLNVSTWPWIAHFIQLRYEDLTDFGTAILINHISNVTGYQPNCTASPPQTDRKKRYLTKNLRDYLSKHIDWEAEALIGYEHWDTRIEK